MRITKRVNFNRRGMEMITITIPRHRRILNAPRAKINPVELGMRKLEFGF